MGLAITICISGISEATNMLAGVSEGLYVPEVWFLVYPHPDI